MPHDRIDQELVLFGEGSLTFLECRFWPAKIMLHMSYAGGMRPGFRVRTGLTRLEFILQVDRPEHRIARARSSIGQQTTLPPGFWSRQWCRGHHDSRHEAIQVFH